MSKKRWAFAAGVAALVASAAVGLSVAFTGDTAEAGNGAPSGAHYTLNIIGTKDKNASPNWSTGNRIFVKLDGITKILLEEGTNLTDFAVIDANGTDGEASFRLPNPDTGACVTDPSTGIKTCGDGTTEYSVFVRALGKPGQLATMTTCIDDPTSADPNVYICNVASLSVSLSHNGRPVFDNVSKELLYLYNVTIGGVTYSRLPLFGDNLEGFFWEYDNQGQRIAQLRFYPCSTDVVNDTSTCNLTGNGN